ncbi:class III lanthionine synthetase LanKC [Stenotrophomonas maltophilia]|uniref:class III lanthionine synthetase LanKC n=1 Tax=Stenotrophomonas maltophilia group TaxID=995085 RepID=UPI00070D019F|nr:class III lanthionine synthetase LanKC [Stenotrophomonas maltophilia]KRG50832.1 membrane translocator [Stenotrophomonas maltophilia]NNH47598.1 protein kinase/lanthionine synthetase C family protein [Stenotrophomonas maltophilia]VEE53944.1 serine/threonine protein kinase [Stenotrophomonas maltophilia]
MSAGNSTLRELRHVDKINFIGSDERFYEPNYEHYKPTDELVSIVNSILLEHGRDWSIRQIGVWSHVLPPAKSGVRPLPSQGWKIHLSAIEENCKQTLQRVAELLLQRDVQFKFANDCRTMRMMTSKRWPRGGSGKFITVYPHTDTEFKELIELLYQEVGASIGSYILSDKRYKDSRCIYYRYGGIIQVNRLDFMGRMIPMLVSPSGDHVPDRRTPYFETPEWAQDPFTSDEENAGELTLNNGRYLIESALGFSNTGGVYLSRDTCTDQKVVIKEARPHVELYENGGDATTRLKREMANLNILGPLGIAPAVLDSFWDWENFYMVEEHFDALDMRQIMLQFSPLMKVRPSAADSEKFYVMYRTIFTNIFRAVDLAHQAGLVIGDLSPPNILVKRESLEVRLIDLEAAFQPSQGESDDIHTPGFRSKMKSRTKVSNMEDDLYAISAIMMYSMFPIVAMAYVRDDLFDNVLPTLVRDIGWEGTPVLNVIRDLAQGRTTLRQAEERLLPNVSIREPYDSRETSSEPLGPLLERLSRFVLQNYRLNPKYTLFPCDPFALSTNATSLGFGSSGVIYSLTRAGVEVPNEVLERHFADAGRLHETNAPPGVLTGLAGIGWAHLAMGHNAVGLNFIDMANRSPVPMGQISLYYGAAGIGMANLAAFVASHDLNYLESALELGLRLASSAVRTENGIYWEDDGVIRIGLGYGQSGVALFFLRLSQATGDAKWRTMGQLALAYDLAQGSELEAGISTFAAAPNGVATYEPYVEQGTAGIIKVAIRYGLWETVESLVMDLYRKYSGFPGLIYGLAGLIDTLVDAYVYSGDARYLDLAKRPYDGLTDIYVFGDDDTAAIPGENLFRISCDYATGIAGSILALHRLSSPHPDDFCLDILDANFLKARAHQPIVAFVEDPA